MQKGLKGFLSLNNTTKRIKINMSMMGHRLLIWSLEIKYSFNFEIEYKVVCYGKISVSK